MNVKNKIKIILKINKFLKSVILLLYYINYLYYLYTIVECINFKLAFIFYTIIF